MAVGIFDESTDIHIIAVPVILIGLFAVAMGIGIKVHLEKVRNRFLFTCTKNGLHSNKKKAKIISNLQLIITQSNKLEELCGK